MSHYIYLLREREFIKCNENVYKIGKTKKEHLKRFNQYPKGSELLVQIRCIDSSISEQRLLNIFRKKYISRKDIGNKYFEGNVVDMIKDITNNILIVEASENKKVKAPVEKVIDSTSNSSEMSINNDCERCGQGFNTKKCLIQHLRKKIECMCIFSEKSRLVILEELLNKEGIECDICNKKYVNIYTLARHKSICK